MSRFSTRMSSTFSLCALLSSVCKVSTGSSCVKEGMQLLHELLAPHTHFTLSLLHIYDQDSICGIISITRSGNPRPRRLLVSFEAIFRPHSSHLETNSSLSMPTINSARQKVTLLSIFQVRRFEHRSSIRMLSYAPRLLNNSK